MMGEGRDDNARTPCYVAPLVFQKNAVQPHISGSDNGVVPHLSHPPNEGVSLCVDDVPFQSHDERLPYRHCLRPVKALRA